MADAQRADAGLAGAADVDGGVADLDGARRRASRPRGRARARSARRATRLRSRTRPGRPGRTAPGRAAPAARGRRAPGSRSGVRGGGPSAARRVERFVRARGSAPAARVGVAQELEVALGELGAPGPKVGLVETGVAAGRAARSAARSGPGGRPARARPRAARRRSARSASRAARGRASGSWVRKSVPSTSKRTSSGVKGPAARASPRRGASAACALTFSSRKTGWPSSCSISGRARVPIFFTIEPPLPTTICFCESVSTKIVARTTFSPSSSTSTEIACGTSSRVSWSAFSRIELGDLQLGREVGALVGAGSRPAPPAAARRARRGARRRRRR